MARSPVAEPSFAVLWYYRTICLDLDFPCLCAAQSPAERRVREGVPNGSTAFVDMWRLEAS